jgi:hypothetical protein
MSRKDWFAAVRASAIILAIVLPAVGRADRGPYHSGPYRGNPPYHGAYYPRPYPHYFPRHYSPYYPAYPCGNCGNDNHHDNHNNYKLWLGILGGGIAGYALSNLYQSGSANPGYYPPAVEVPASPTVTRYPGPASVSPCLQEREYRTKAMVGNKEVDGYGTACLQPDGSWRYGPVQTGAY